MLKETKTALLGSIKHWKENLAQLKMNKKNHISLIYKIEIYNDTCPLCKLFNNLHQACYGCPIREKTGFQYCLETPWTDVYHLIGVKHSNYTSLLEAIEEEIAFLESLV